MQVFEKDNWECLRCDCENKTLHAHHLEYENGKDPWDYNIADIVTLCEDCHTLAHDENHSEQIFKEIRKLTSSEHQEIFVFNDFYDEYCSKKNLGNSSIDRYCKSIRAYFSDSEINFTTLKNIIKRIGSKFFAIRIQSLIFTKDWDEIDQLIFLSQKFNDLDNYSFTSLEDIIDNTIKKISSHSSTMYIYKKALKDMNFWINSLKEYCLNVMQNYLIKLIAYEKKIDFKLYNFKVEDFISEIYKLQKNEGSTDRTHYLWNEKKWIECFDSIDYTPPELRCE